MATRRIASGARRGGRGDKTRSVEHVYGVPVPEGLHEAIEFERGNLSKAESLLGCLVISMEYEADCADKPYYPDVAQLARELVKQSINRLDSLAIQRRLMRNKIKEEADLRPIAGAYPILEPVDSILSSVCALPTKYRCALRSSFIRGSYFDR